MNAKARIAQRRHASFRPLAYAACSMPRGSIGPPPERGAGVYVITRSGLDTCRHQTPPGSRSWPEYVLSWNPGTPLWATQTPYGGSGSHSRGPVCTHGGPGPILEVWTIYRGPTLSHGGPDSLFMPWGISLSLDTWRLRTHPCGGVRRCC
jgi:hypothetical protein